jgi:thiamine kinase-like enzyme
MAFLLSSQNIFKYLEAQGICLNEDRDSIQVECKYAKNFNLLLSLSNGRKLLVKQEPHHLDGETVGEFLNEYRIHQLIEQFPQLDHWRYWLPELLHYDPVNSIAVFNYLTDYRDLADFYSQENQFPEAIAHTIGTILATIHRNSFEQLNYQTYLHNQSDSESEVTLEPFPLLARQLERISPDIFGLVPMEGLKFFKLYQRYDSLGQAMASLSNAIQPCCLIHGDLKFNNLLLHHQWEEQSISGRSSPIRLIDWERCTWGDPAYDLGSLIASYLQLWIGSLVVSQSIDIHEALRLAATPLEQLQPSIATLVKSYLETFPEILKHQPDFLMRTVQFSGFGLIQQIYAMIQYQKTFNNTGICMLQVAKSLLCRPEQSISTIFGVIHAELLSLSHLPA